MIYIDSPQLHPNDNVNPSDDNTTHFDDKEVVFRTSAHVSGNFFQQFISYLEIIPDTWDVEIGPCFLQYKYLKDNFFK